jgi:hypothetical protein
MMTESLAVSPEQQTRINSAITVGYLTAMCGGLGFGYFGQSPLLHGLFLFGLAVAFYAGCLLAVALWPWRREHRVESSSRAQTPGGVDLERVAFFAVTVAVLGSSLLGAAAGASYGQGFQTFLAGDTIRKAAHSVLEYAVIGHLYLMVALLAVAVALLVGN